MYEVFDLFKCYGQDNVLYRTPDVLIDKMLGWVPEKNWTNRNAKFLLPSVKFGLIYFKVFDRLMESLSNQILDKTQREKHIVSNMIWAAEPDLVGAKTFERLLQRTGLWKHGPNVLFGNPLEVQLDMKFDVCIQNPPYQDRISPDRPNSKDIFHHFVEWSHQHSNVTIALTPSRWFFKKSLNSYKEWLIAPEQGLRCIWHTDDDGIFGNGVSVKGGVCFIVLDANYKGPTYVSFLNDYTDLTQNNARILNSRSLVAESILAKTTSEVFLSSVYKPTLYYKITTNDSRVVSEQSDKSVKIYVNKKRGFEAWIEKELIEHIDTFNTWKVIHRSADGKGNDYTTFSHIAKPGEAVSQSYCHFSFESENECLNYQTYFQTNFYRFLMKCGKKKQHLYSAAFSYIPLVSFDEAWDDEKLAKKFGLTEEEVAYINEQVG
jgi:site-specific DNA-methyltransferase (adenine-specific)